MGTEEFWVPAAMAAISGGAEYMNKKAAAKREDAGQTQSIIDQQNLQKQAVGQVSALTRQVGANSPQTIAGKATGDYVAQLRKNQGGKSSALAPAVGASSRYARGIADGASDVDNFGNTTANEMGSIDAAVRQRQNEALGMQTLGTGLNQLGAQSYTKHFVDQLRAQAGGQENPTVSLFAGLLGNAAKSYTSSGPKDKTKYVYGSTPAANAATEYDYAGGLS